MPERSRQNRTGTRNRQRAKRRPGVRVPLLGRLSFELERPEKKPRRARAKASAKSATGRAAKAPKLSKRSGEDRTGVMKFAYWGTVAALWAGVAFGGLLMYYALTLPDTDDLWNLDGAPGVSLIAADGSLVVSRGGFNGGAVRLDDLPTYLPQAVIATEDRRFYAHFGIDPIGLARALYTNVRAGAVVQGGSTITQQLAKNVFLTPDRTLERKLQELMLAIWLEARFSKEQILTLYLNRVYLGGGAYGVEAAAQRYFGKSAREVTLPEAAMLAGLLKAPSRYAPTNDLARAQDRAATVLANMVRAGYIEHSDGQWAYEHPAELRGMARASSANYFADWVVEQLPGYAGRPNSTLIVETTLDPELQAAAERAITQLMNSEGLAQHATQAALVAMTPNGAIRAMVGGRDYRRSQFNRAVLAQRQPGSAFKPVVYLAALERGLTPDTLRVDAPISVDGWEPRNYSEDHRGAMTLTEALSRSVNTIAVQVSEEVGRHQVIHTARRLGLRSDMEPHASLALGTFEVNLMELTAAYAVFSNGGESVIPHAIRNVRTASGDMLYQRRGSGFGPIISSHALGMMNHMLSETVRSGTGRRAALGRRPVAGKTGTSQDFRDAWFIGYTADLVVGVWVGNDDNSPMDRVTGGGLPARIWQAFMSDTQSGTRMTALPGYYAPDRLTTGSIGRVDEPPAETEEDPGFFGRLFGHSGTASGRDLRDQGFPLRPGRNSWR